MTPIKSIKTEVLDATGILFGDLYTSQPQSVHQPLGLLVSRPD